MSFSDRYLSAHLPDNITLTLPDDVKLGQAAVHDGERLDLER